MARSGLAISFRSYSALASLLSIDRRRLAGMMPRRAQSGPRGGIGRRARLKIWFLQGSVCSSQTGGTNAALRSTADDKTAPDMAPFQLSRWSAGI